MAEINKRKNEQKMSKEALQHYKVMKEYGINAEANIVLSFYKKPDELYNTTLRAEDFLDNCWRVYFTIAYDIIIKEKKTSLDELTIGFYLEQHPKLKEKYFEYNGYDTIVKGVGYVDVGNLDSYIDDMTKWRLVMKYYKDIFSFDGCDVSRYADMRAEDVLNEFQHKVDALQMNTPDEAKGYSMTQNLAGLIENLDQGEYVGLPFYGMEKLTTETGGQCLGSITLLGGISNAGKSSVVRDIVLPSVLKYGEKVVVMINEDSKERWQEEMLVWVCNNVFHHGIEKSVVHRGNHDETLKAQLVQAKEWLEEKAANEEIILLPLMQYRTSTAIRQIRKYAAYGCKYFILDTFKMDAGKVSNNSWLEMQQSMVDIKDTVKSEALNVHILITFQLEKGSSKTRYFTQSNIGMAKNIVDVASTCIMIRDFYPDEYPGEKNEIKVVKPNGKGSNVRVTLEPDKTYQLFFIVKNQRGPANAHQIVAEHDKGRNLINEVGFTNISPDF